MGWNPQKTWMIMQQEPFTTQDIEHLHKGKLICKQCTSGSMLPAIQEGEPEYTDHFICDNCGFHDAIPTQDILFNQILTGILGFILSAYLFIIHLSGLFTGIQHDSMKNALQDASLTGLSAIFSLGFIYILFRAHLGIKHRSEYSPKNKQPNLT